MKKYSKVKEGHETYEIINTSSSHAGTMMHKAISIWCYENTLNISKFWKNLFNLLALQSKLIMMMNLLNFDKICYLL